MREWDEEPIPFWFIAGWACCVLGSFGFLAGTVWVVVHVVRHFT